MVSNPACPPLNLAAAPAYATVTETALLRGRVTELEALVLTLQKKIETMEAANAELRRIVKGMRDGVWISQGEKL